MERIYFDNAATTPIDTDVLEAMLPFFKEQFGNPSSIYSYGRETRMAIEKARKSIAAILGAKPAEIFFTSGGTESTNTVLHAAVTDLGCKHIISSPIEHHATLHTVEYLAKVHHVKLSYVGILPNGHIDINQLEELLNNSSEKTIVTIMHANNEIGNCINLNEVGALCKKHSAYFHSDTVQTVGHFNFDLKNIPVDFITGAGHKFHGPKGVGFAYVRKNLVLQPMIFGGEQEKGWRAGTESVHQIAGMAKAVELALANLNEERKGILELKNYLIERLEKEFPDFKINGSKKVNVRN